MYRNTLDYPESTKPIAPRPSIILYFSHWYFLLRCLLPASNWNAWVTRTLQNFLDRWSLPLDRRAWSCCPWDRLRNSSLLMLVLATSVVLVRLLVMFDSLSLVPSLALARSFVTGVYHLRFYVTRQERVHLWGHLRILWLFLEKAAQIVKEVEGIVSLVVRFNDRREIDVFSIDSFAHHRTQVVVYLHQASAAAVRPSQNRDDLLSEILGAGAVLGQDCRTSSNYSVDDHQPTKVIIGSILLISIAICWLARDCLELSILPNDLK